MNLTQTVLERYQRLNLSRIFKDFLLRTLRSKSFSKGDCKYLGIYAIAISVSKKIRLFLWPMLDGKQYEIVDIMPRIVILRTKGGKR